MQADRPWTWRIEHIPRGTTREQLKLFFIKTDRSRIEVESLVPESIAPDLFYHEVANRCLTATISFRAQEGRTPQLVDEFHGKIGLDADFYGFTSLYSPEREPIAAESVCPRFCGLKLIHSLQCRSCDWACGPCLWFLDASSYTLSHADVVAGLSSQRDFKY